MRKLVSQKLKGMKKLKKVAEGADSLLVQKLLEPVEKQTSVTLNLNNGAGEQPGVSVQAQFEVAGRIPKETYHKFNSMFGMSERDNITFTLEADIDPDYVATGVFDVIENYFKIMREEADEWEPKIYVTQHENRVLIGVRAPMSWGESRYLEEV